MRHPDLVRVRERQADAGAHGRRVLADLLVLTPDVTGGLFDAVQELGVWVPHGKRPSLQDRVQRNRSGHVENAASAATSGCKHEDGPGPRGTSTQEPTMKYILMMNTPGGPYQIADWPKKA